MLYLYELLTMDYDISDEMITHRDIFREEAMGI